MKTKKNRRPLNPATPSQPAYPNAADTSYFIGKALNIMTALVSGMGFATAMVLLVALV